MAAYIYIYMRTVLISSYAYLRLLKNPPIKKIRYVIYKQRVIYYYRKNNRLIYGINCIEALETNDTRLAYVSYMVFTASRLIACGRETGCGESETNVEVGFKRGTLLKGLIKGSVLLEILKSVNKHAM